MASEKWADKILVLTENLEHRVYSDPPATAQEKAALYHLREAERTMRDPATEREDDDAE